MRSGTLEHDGVPYRFTLDGSELSLIRNGSTGSGFMIFSDEIADQMTDGRWLFGQCDIDDHKILMLPEPGWHINNGEILLGIQFSIDMKRDGLFGRMTFECDALNHVFDTENCFRTSQFEEDGRLEITLRSFGDTSAGPFDFRIDERPVRAYFNYRRKSDHHSKTIPIEIYSQMIFEFEETDDLEFVLEAFRCARVFISFLCFRISAATLRVKLSEKNENGRYADLAEMKCRHAEAVTEQLEYKEMARCARIGRLHSGIANMLNAISLESIYVDHIPKYYVDRNHITAAYYLLLSAGFEWEFDALYPGGCGDEREQTEKQTAREVIGKLAEEQKGKNGVLRKIYKQALQSVDEDKLERRLCRADEMLPYVWEYFKKGHRVSEGKAELISATVDRRNCYAHGNIRETIGEIALHGIIYLRQLLFAMQLTRFGIEEKEILDSMRDLRL